MGEDISMASIWRLTQELGGIFWMSILAGLAGLVIGKCFKYVRDQWASYRVLSTLPQPPESVRIFPMFSLSHSSSLFQAKFLSLRFSFSASKTRHTNSLPVHCQVKISGFVCLSIYALLHGLYYSQLAKECQ